MTKSATRKELADAAGVSVKTFNRWLKPIMPQLVAMGFTRRTRIFTPSMTKLISKHFDLERDLKDSS